MNCIACALFLSNKFISYVAFYIGPIQTGFLRGFQKKLRRNRNRDSCEKSATGTENTEIRRIPAGITNLAGRFFAAFSVQRRMSKIVAGGLIAVSIDDVVASGCPEHLVALGNSITFV